MVLLKLKSGYSVGRIDRRTGLLNCLSIHAGLGGLRQKFSSPHIPHPPPEFSQDPLLNKKGIVKMYQDGKSRLAEKTQFDLQPKNPRGVFANNELELSGIDVFGFDYDYTLAAYSPELYHLIYDMAKKVLVNVHNYPKELADVPYNTDFSVRGLHFDVGRSLLMKIDAYHNIQLGTVYRGLMPVSDDEVREIYGGTHIALDMLNNFYGKNVGPSMVHLIDLFSPPETMLLATTVEYFQQRSINFDSEHVFWDIYTAVRTIHTTGQLHKAIIADVSRYLVKGSGNGIREFLERLHLYGKQLFMITNSGHEFVDKGLTYLVGPDWKGFFDVIVCHARKPKFFYQNTRPFRQLNQDTDTQSWDRVTEFQKSRVYTEGNLAFFIRMTNWAGSQVLYFGDHVYSDLADATLKHGWRTGAIIPEVEREIQIQSSVEFTKDLFWLSTLQCLIEKLQETPGSTQQNQVLDSWLDERNDLRLRLKSMFNPKFGSLFRTHHNPTYFSRRLIRFADIYTSSLSNLLPYSLNHTFYPARAALPHEWQVKSLLPN